MTQYISQCLLCWRIPKLSADYRSYVLPCKVRGEGEEVMLGKEKLTFFFLICAILLLVVLANGATPAVECADNMAFHSHGTEICSKCQIHVQGKIICSHLFPTRNVAGSVAMLPLVPQQHLLRFDHGAELMLFQSSINFPDLYWLKVCRVIRGIRLIKLLSSTLPLLTGLPQPTSSLLSLV